MVSFHDSFKVAWLQAWFHLFCLCYFCSIHAFAYGRRRNKYVCFMTRTIDRSLPSPLFIFRSKMTWMIDVPSQLLVLRGLELLKGWDVRSLYKSPLRNDWLDCDFEFRVLLMISSFPRLQDYYWSRPCLRPDKKIRLSHSNNHVGCVGNLSHCFLKNQ